MYGKIVAGAFALIAIIVATNVLVRPSRTLPGQAIIAQGCSQPKTPGMPCPGAFPIFAGTMCTRMGSCTTANGAPGTCTGGTCYPFLTPQNSSAGGTTPSSMGGANGGEAAGGGGAVAGGGAGGAAAGGGDGDGAACQSDTDCDPSCNNKCEINDELGCVEKCGNLNCINGTCQAGHRSCDASQCSSECGDGFVTGAEECDDGNAASNDGCSSRCIEEFCGDGIVQNSGGQPQASRSLIASLFDSIFNFFRSAPSETDAIWKKNPESFAQNPPDSGQMNAPADIPPPENPGGTPPGTGTPPPENPGGPPPPAAPSPTPPPPAPVGPPPAAPGNPPPSPTSPQQPTSSCDCKGGMSACLACFSQVSGADAQGRCNVLCKSGDMKEECDDGNTNDGDGCSNQCKKESGSSSASNTLCGNGQYDYGEECDSGKNNGNVNSQCRPDCTLAHCGDGIIDDRQPIGPNGSKVGTIPYSEQCDCGKGVPQSEAPDGSGYHDYDCDITIDGHKATCTYYCRALFICPNGKNGSIYNTDPCFKEGVYLPGPNCPDLDDSCSAGSKCGNRKIDAGEQCDLGSVCVMSKKDCSACPASQRDTCCGPGDYCNVDASYQLLKLGESGCTNTCTKTTILCGNGKMDNDGYEQCDTGVGRFGNGSAECRLPCRAPYCGDEVVDKSEGKVGQVNGFDEQCDVGAICTGVTEPGWESLNDMECTTILHPDEYKEGEIDRVFVHKCEFRGGDCLPKKTDTCDMCQPVAPLCTGTEPTVSACGLNWKRVCDNIGGRNICHCAVETDKDRAKKLKPRQKFTLPNDNGFTAVVTGDFNSDGWMDIIVEGWKDTVARMETRITLLQQNADGTFESTPFPLAYRHDQMAKGDFNGDGKLDLVTTRRKKYKQNESAAREIAFHFGRGNGTFEAGSITPLTKYEPDGMQIADLDQDGRDDIAVNVKTEESSGTKEVPGGTLVILTKGGSPFLTFGNPESDYWSGKYVGLATDVNGDGIVDLITTTGPPKNGTVAMYTHLGKGDGTFKEPFLSLPYCSWTSWEMKAGDLNKDGNKDIVVSDGSMHIRILQGDGTGKFQLKGVYKMVDSANNKGGHIEVSDVACDGNEDVIVLGQDSTLLGVMAGKGNSTFEPGVGDTDEQSKSDVVVTDIDGDTDNDVVILNSNGTFTIHKNTCVSQGSSSSGGSSQSSGGPITHAICQNSMCVSVAGAGANECPTVGQPCTPKHLTCIGNACTLVDGGGADLCLSDNDCTGSSSSGGSSGGGVTHAVCQNSLCVSAQGPGTNTCVLGQACGSSQSSGSPLSHTICQNSMCVSVAGAGANVCTLGLPCGVTSHAACQNSLCVSVPGPGANTCVLGQACGSSQSSSNSSGGGQSCGNGQLDAGEECEDGNHTNGDGCSQTCRIEPGRTPRCGDNILTSSEDCDDGNVLNGDGCSSTCQRESGVCGNGILNTGEECDDANRLNGDGCSTACKTEPGTTPRCDDNIVTVGEDCDDGNAVDGDGCSSTCQNEPGVCGNGTLNAGEECEDGNLISNDGCNAACRLEGNPTFCGDAIITAGEDCDDGNVQDGDSCSRTCQNESDCGNFHLDTTEECDDGNRVSGDLCSVSCRWEGDALPRCGDRTITRGEECDDGNLLNGDGCTTACRKEELQNITCGNRVLEPHEQCEDGNKRNGDGCSAICTLEAGHLSRCGDAMLVQGEECDDANSRDFDGCSSECYFETGRCGDSVLQRLLGEQCEATLHDPTLPYRCGTDCRNLSLFCGNSTLDAGEECDAGAQNNDRIPGACRLNCSAARCGDGTIDTEETCDDGNRLSGDGCDRHCRREGFGAAPGVASNILELPTLPGSQSLDALRADLAGQQYSGLGQASAIAAGHAPAGETGPAAIAVMAAGAAAGFGWMRRKKRL